MIGVIQQWKQDINGKVTLDNRCLVIALGGERSLCVLWKPFRISYNSFIGGA